MPDGGATGVILEPSGIVYGPYTTEQVPINLPVEEVTDANPITLYDLGPAYSPIPGVPVVGPDPLTSLVVPPSTPPASDYVAIGANPYPTNPSNPYPDYTPLDPAPQWDQDPVTWGIQ